ncbi:hypothetical protein Taro_001087 [Colocasia esculenta]|uniref:Uncharacterized protein n=1 Tax=Colocasia esculenta TaxID=4460 RepID=A0A843TGT3_COLES|nr:hypothetical protein [Colocasia esculenta]
MDHILTIGSFQNYVCRQATCCCRQLLLISGFHVAGRLRLSTDIVLLSTGTLHLSTSTYWLSTAWVHCVVPCEAPGASVGTVCRIACLIVSFVRRFPSLLSVRGVELSAFGTLYAGLCLVTVSLPLWGDYFALSSRTTRRIWVRSSGAGRHCLARRSFSMCVFSAWFWVTIKKLSFGLAIGASCCLTCGAIQRSLLDDLLASSSIAVSSWDLCLVTGDRGSY